jgi:hypothetical protein
MRQGRDRIGREGRREFEPITGLFVSFVNSFAPFVMNHPAVSPSAQQRATAH